MAKDIYQHGNMILSRPNKRGVSKKGIFITQKDTLKPTKFRLYKVNDYTLILDTKQTAFFNQEKFNNRKYDYLNEELEKQKDAIIVARQYALTHNQSLHVHNNFNDFYGLLTENVVTNNSKLPALYSELKEAAHNGTKITILTQGQGIFCFPKDLKIHISPIRSFSDATYEFIIMDSDKKSDDFSNIHFKSPHKYARFTLNCTTEKDLKPPTLLPENKSIINVINLKGKDVLFGDEIKNIQKTYKDTIIIINNFIPEFITNIYSDTYNFDTDINHIKKTLKHIKSLGVQNLENYIHNLKEFYKNTPKLKYLQIHKELETSKVIPEKTLNIIKEIEKENEKQYSIEI